MSLTLCEMTQISWRCRGRHFCGETEKPCGSRRRRRRGRLQSGSWVTAGFDTNAYTTCATNLSPGGMSTICSILHRLAQFAQICCRPKKIVCCHMRGGGCVHHSSGAFCHSSGATLAPLSYNRCMNSEDLGTVLRSQTWHLGCKDKIRKREVGADWLSA